MRRFSVLLVVFVPLMLSAGAGCGPSEATSPPSSAEIEVPDAEPLEMEISVRGDTLPELFSYLRDLAPGIIQEIRYTTAFNFVGEPIDGYEAAECILTTRAARALADVQIELEADGYSLKVYDCYRP